MRTGSAMDFFFDLHRTLRFATRLPLPVLAREADDPIISADRFAPAFAACGAVVGGLGGLVAVGCVALGMTPIVASVIAIAAMVLVTGALHEDGLADCADGIGGGRTRERKLAIMRDPAIGTYGVLALILSVGARIGALAAILAVSPWAGLAVLVATQSLSRAASMGVASRLDHARPEGAAARLGRPSPRAARASLGMGALVALLALVPAVGAIGAIASLLAALLAMGIASVLVVRGAQRHIGGQTGDVLGANQQLTDLAGLLTFSISLAVIV
jgi:adenosylcobinamide-GDP ribazoletransferase